MRLNVGRNSYPSLDLSRVASLSFRVGNAEARGVIRGWWEGICLRLRHLLCYKFVCCSNTKPDYCPPFLVSCLSRKSNERLQKRRVQQPRSPLEQERKILPNSTFRSTSWPVCHSAYSSQLTYYVTSTFNYYEHDSLEGILHFVYAKSNHTSFALLFTGIYICPGFLFLAFGQAHLFHIRMFLNTRVPW